MSTEAVEKAARADPDAQPLTPADFKHMKARPRVQIIRRALDLTQEEFAERYHIPLGTLRDWEQGRAEPDQPTRAYLTLIARDPEHVSRVLNLGSRSPDESVAAAARRLATFGKRHGLSPGGRTAKKLLRESRP
jgi:putative transcriptional regulator